MIFDSHAHYDDQAFQEDRDSLLRDMPKKGIGAIVNISASYQGLCDSLALAEKYPFLYAAIGLHPDHAEELNDDVLKEMKEYCKHPKVVAIGEIGLDYYWNKQGRSLQRECFIRQLSLAKEVKLPVVIHSREAARETFEILKREHAHTTGGVIHCYSGSKEMVRDYLNLGYEIGVGGVVTFKNAKVLKEVVEYVPLDRILVETDCPYLAPAPYRGKRNSSLLIPYILEVIAQIKGVGAEEVEQAVWKNACRLYQVTPGTIGC